MGKQRIVLAVVTVAALGLTAACSSSGGSSKSGSSGSSSGGGNTVTLGVLTSESGALAAYGDPFGQAVSMAVAKLNQAGGFKVGGKTYTFTVKTVDDKSANASAVAGANQLINDDHAVAIFGPLGALGPTVTQLATAAKVLNFSSSSAVAAIAGPPKNPLTFITNGSATSRIKAAFDAIKADEPNAKKIALLGPDDDTGAALAPVISTQAGAAGYQFQKFIFPVDSTDLSTTLTNLAAFKPDVIISGWNADQYKAQIDQFAAAGIPKSTALLLVSGSIGNCQQIATGYPCMAHPLAGADLTSPDLTPARKQFVTDYETFTKTSALPAQSAPILWTYDFPGMLAQAMTKAGSVTDTTAIASALHSLTYSGILGNVTFDANNDAIFGFDISLVAPDGTVKTANYS